MEQILKVENINVYYGAIHAIKGVSFHVDEGEMKRRMRGREKAIMERLGEP